MINEKRAGLGSRLVALFLDSFIVMTLIAIISLLIEPGYTNTWRTEAYGQAVYALYITITPLLWSGYIIGKRILNIRVVRHQDGKNVTLGNMFMREIVGYYLIGIFTLGISVIVSLFMVAFREDKRAVHDFVGGTKVIHSKGSFT
ncbi:RDD family protein [Alkalicoccus daliensis]|uniref:Uncharacterized membrane protein YckC, RDD family n=1 Tax=Alkalicoccus daliensis TaxID=745820 RepID=A0A1H0HB50_9BACI|nr:RDD family protein [Alkalicoccus daliensis]SDO16284.1 Uncharacterized membrane protein YckC, RDD family [Alkalicoccus daliensis]